MILIIDRYWNSIPPIQGTSLSAEKTKGPFQWVNLQIGNIKDTQMLELKYPS